MKTVKPNLPNPRIALCAAHRVEGTDWLAPDRTSAKPMATASGMGPFNTVQLPLNLKTTTVAENVDLTCKRILALTYLRGCR